MTTIALPNTYPIELTPPDITPYAKGNTDIPYVWTFDSGAAGPHVMVSAIVHGNEPCGAIAIDWLMREDVRPVAGKLTMWRMSKHDRTASLEVTSGSIEKLVLEDNQPGNTSAISYHSHMQLSHRGGRLT